MTKFAVDTSFPLIFRIGHAHFFNRFMLDYSADSILDTIIFGISFNIVISWRWRFIYYLIFYPPGMKQGGKGHHDHPAHTRTRDIGGPDSAWWRFIEPYQPAFYRFKLSRILIVCHQGNRKAGVGSYS